MLFASRSTSLTAAALRRRSAGALSSTFRQAWQQSRRQGYASIGHQVTEKAKSDLPWLAGAIAVTVPSCWYLLREGPVKPHDHEPGQDHVEHPEHDEAPEDAEVDEKKADDRLPVEEAVRKPKDGNDRKANMGLAAGTKDDTSEESDGEDDDQNESPNTSAEEEPETEKGEQGEKEEKDGGGDVEGVRGTAPRSSEGNTREHIPDAKGYNKKRISSDNAKTSGKAQSEENMPDKGDKAASSKPAGGQNTQSGKQEGLSNTDTKHSTQIEEREDASMKPEGPETSKAKGTIDPNREQV